MYKGSSIPGMTREEFEQWFDAKYMTRTPASLARVIWETFTLEPRPGTNMDAPSEDK